MSTGGNGITRQGSRSYVLVSGALLVQGPEVGLQGSGWICMHWCPADFASCGVPVVLDSILCTPVQQLHHADQCWLAQLTNFTCLAVMYD